MSPSSGLKTNFAVIEKHGAFYTGGKVQVTNDGDHLICGCGNTIKVVAIDSGQVKLTLGQDEDPAITAFAVSPDDKHLVVASQNLLLRHWNWAASSILRSWKAIHVGPILCLSFDSTSTLLASGGSDHTIKVWDITRQYWTHNLKGHSGVITCILFHPNAERLELYSSADDYKIRVWNLPSGSCTAILDGHFSTVTCLAVSPQEENHLFSGGRDKVVIIWDTKQNKRVKTIPVYEAVEAVFVLRNGQTKINAKDDATHFVTAGSMGVLRMWDSTKAACVYSQESSPAKHQEGQSHKEDDVMAASSYQQFGFCEAAKMFYAVTRDHHIVYFKEKTLKPYRQLIGHNDEVVDVQFFGETEEYVVVATNSHKIKVFEHITWDSVILDGHTDVVVSLAVYKTGKLFVSGSKDTTFRLWAMSANFRDITCVFVGQGHTLPVSAVAFSRSKSDFLVTAGHDCTLKLWPLPTGSCGFANVYSSLTQKAHDKDINSVDASPNDKYIVSASQDKTAKIWLTSDLSLVGVLRGHARGIWCVRFSPVDQCLVTASADGKLKIWALADMTCVKSFEGHESSVLKVCFVCRGMQLISCGSDGLVKLWTIKTSECVKTFDEHDEKIWALACSSKENLVVTGSADSQLVVWKDVTELDMEEEQKKLEESVVQEQELSNLLHKKNFLRALQLSLALDRPASTLQILRELLGVGVGVGFPVAGGADRLGCLITELSTDHLDCLLRYCVEWNTNSRNCSVAQHTLRSIVLHTSPAVILSLPNVRSYIEALIPYTERHVQRLNRLEQQTMLVRYTWQCMKLKESSASAASSADQ